MGWERMEFRAWYSTPGAEQGSEDTLGFASLLRTIEITSKVEAHGEEVAQLIYELLQAKVK